MTTSSSTSNSTTIPLIVGGDGLIGSALAEAFRHAGASVLSTTRRESLVSETRPWLNLARDPERWEPPVGVDVAYLCAGETRTEACNQDPSGTARTNVDGLMTVAARLHARGARIVFLSTNQVFDGTQAHVTCSEHPRPVTEYGRQKAYVEKALLDLGEGVTIVRLTKVLGPAHPLLSEWQRRLRSGLEIRPFSDMVLSPISLALTVRALTMIGSRDIQGVVQISGDRDISYADVAVHLADLAAVSKALVRPISVRDRPFTHDVPRFTTLDTARMRSELHLAPSHWRDVVDQAIDGH